MRKKKLRLTWGKGSPRISDSQREPVSGLTAEEEARALMLADIALHNPTEPHANAPAGSRAKAEHRRLIEELQREAEKSRRSSRVA